jgi:hypothetical protein
MVFSERFHKAAAAAISRSSSAPTSVEGAAGKAVAVVVEPTSPPPVMATKANNSQAVVDACKDTPTTAPNFDQDVSMWTNTPGSTRIRILGHANADFNDEDIYTDEDNAAGSTTRANNISSSARSIRNMVNCQKRRLPFIKNRKAQQVTR